MRLLVMFSLLCFCTETLQFDARVRELNTRVAKLEEYIQTLESKLVQKYGLIQHCEMPIVDYGRVICSHHQPSYAAPGQSCRIICDSGYINTPGHQNSTCLEGGHWSLELKCEVPVVIISGGQIGDVASDSSIEILDLNDQKHCKPYIPDMPLQNGTNRNLHNLIYDQDKLSILNCAGLSTAVFASCDSWTFQPPASEWQFHTLLHEGSEIQMAIDAMDRMRGPVNEDELYHPHRNKGRYAAESMVFNSRPMVLGGMIYDTDTHKATKSTRGYMVNRRNDEYWESSGPCRLKIPRAFFCSVKVDEYGIVNIGGFSNKTTTSDVQFRACDNELEDQDLEYQAFIKVNGIGENMTDLPIPLSGHACSTLPNSRDILLTGGKRFEKDTSKPHTYLYSWEKKTWNKQWDMVQPRFGHKLVTIGHKMFAIGGRNENKVIDTIEEFDPVEGKWKEVEIKLKKPRAHFGLALVPKSVLATC